MFKKLRKEQKKEQNRKEEKQKKEKGVVTSKIGQRQKNLCSFSLRGNLSCSRRATRTESNEKLFCSQTCGASLRPWAAWGGGWS